MFTEGCFGAAGYADHTDVPDDAARVSLGCGNPLAVVDLHEGETVLDLGSGGGLDVLLSARRVGGTGWAYGLDASEDMLRLARANAAREGASNVEFLQGYLEDVPLPDRSVDVVISNCVITLSTDKPRALAEAFRVLKPGGRLGISDIVADGSVSGPERRSAEERVGCPIGTLTCNAYLDVLTTIGFTNAEVTFTQHVGAGVHSAIIRATKPALGSS
ncbi:methyltransferase domain-containing protein [Saccharopolyspora sp. K220]|nr:methyltransferase domain-containing protein [Saccharopolyspora soli]